MIKVRGTPVFPSGLEMALEKSAELTGRCQIIVDKRTPRQEVILKVETRRDLSKMSQELVENHIRREIKSKIGITLDGILFVPFGAFEDKMKKRRVIE